MSGISTKFTYKQLLTLKHAVLLYLKRADITPEDYQSEQALLLKLNQQIEVMKEKMS